MLLAEAFDPLRSVRVSWALLRRAPVTILVGGLLPIGLQIALQVPLQFLFPLGMFAATQASKEQMQAFLPILFVIAIGMGLACFAIQCWLDVGLCRAVERVLRGGREETQTLFRGLDRFWTLVLARILFGLAYTALFLPLLILLPVVGIGMSTSLPGAGKFLLLLAAGGLWTLVALYFALGFSMVTAIVALERCSATAAISRSWRFANGNRLQLLWFHFFVWLLSIGGMMACCVGWFVAIPLIEVMRYEAYVALTKGTQYPQWWIGTGQTPGEFSSTPPSSA